MHEPLSEVLLLSFRLATVLLFAAPSHLGMHGNMTMVAEGLKVVKIVHELLLSPRGEGILDGHDVVNLGCLNVSAFFEATLAERILRELAPAQHEPAPSVDEFVVGF